jgi:hypothetical protein
MEIYRIIRELLEERDRLQRIIESLEEVAFPGKASARPDGKRRGRKSMDRAAREEVSARMRRYWAKRKAERGGHAKSQGVGGNGKTSNGN